ncbi:MAG: dethiobiotin synthase [Gammaproteobacteria bacterium]|nr:dethiobiotin synthase [Gammaproteobacteria bacterium]
MNGIFITGTDTNVGKTYIGSLLARQLAQQGLTLVPRKPVESGCSREGTELIPADAMALKNAAGYAGSLAQVCPFRFEPPISPLRAAHLAHQALTTSKVAHACLASVDESRDFLLVEGAGGFYTPLCEDGLNADLAQVLNLPVILVAEDRLGCINQVLLNSQAIEIRQLKLLAVVLNRSDAAEQNEFMNNREDLQSLLDCPILPVSTDNRIEQQIVDLAHIITNAVEQHQQ